MTRIIAILALFALTACGADGEPVHPTMNAGIGVGTNGVMVRTGVGVKSGPVRLGVGLGL